MFFIAVITGGVRRGVISAKTRIDLLVDSARQKHPFTHFLSIPLHGSTIRKKLEEFRTAVLAKCSEVNTHVIRVCLVSIATVHCIAHFT